MIFPRKGSSTVLPCMLRKLSHRHHRPINHFFTQSFSHLTSNHKANHNNNAHQTKTQIITTPIFYVNGPPHIGHLYTTLLADTMKHWYTIQSQQDVQKSSWLITGTDEHGSKVQKSVMSNTSTSSSLTSAEEMMYDYCTNISLQFQKLCSDFQIEYDSYVRTTHDFHKRVVCCLWNRLMKNDAIYMGEYNGWYCMSDECFQTDVISVVDPVTGEEKMVSKLSGHTCEWLTEKNYKFRLSKYRPLVLQWLHDNANHHLVTPVERFREVVSALSRHEEDQDLSVSRTRERVQWGIPVPGDSSQTIYVWLDALANYITGSLKESDFPVRKDGSRDIDFDDLKNKLLEGGMWPPRVQILGKDIIKFHAFYWPAFLMALDLPLPQQFIVHPYWTVDRVKMSKSLGNVLNPSQLVADIVQQQEQQQLLRQQGNKSASSNKVVKPTLSVEDARDYVRYYLLREGNLRDDSNFSTAEFADRVNELANAFGNLWNRMFNKRFVPGPRTITYHQSHVGAAGELIERINKLQTTLRECYQSGDVKPGIVHTFVVLHRCNELFDELKPWLWLKEATNPERSESERAEIEKQIESLMFVVAETLRCCAIALYPIMPRRMSKLLQYFNVERVDIADLQFAVRGEQLHLKGHASDILFPKLSGSINTK